VFCAPPDDQLRLLVRRGAPPRAAPDNLPLPAVGGQSPTAVGGSLPAQRGQSSRAPMCRGAAPLIIAQPSWDARDARSALLILCSPPARHGGAAVPHFAGQGSSSLLHIYGSVHSGAFCRGQEEPAHQWVCSTGPPCWTRSANSQLGLGRPLPTGSVWSISTFRHSAAVAGPQWGLPTMQQQQSSLKEPPCST
jgi:hypothetical protein